MGQLQLFERLEKEEAQASGGAELHWLRGEPRRLIGALGPRIVYPCFQTLSAMREMKQKGPVNPGPSLLDLNKPAH